MRSLLIAVVVGVTFAACGSNPPPTSTAPAMSGSAPILPSPVSAETVPRSEPAPSASQ